MKRITEYSGGVEVIPHDRIKEAAAKLAAYEDAGAEPKEQMEKLIAEMMALVCDNLNNYN